MFRFRSVSNIVIAPANTGRDRRSSEAVISVDHTNNGMRSRLIPLQRIFIVVVIKFSALIMEEAPAKCKEKITKSTDGPACEIFLESGG